MSGLRPIELIAQSVLCEQGNTESCTYCTFREICAFDGKIPGFEKRKPGHGMDVLKDEQDIIEKMRKQSGSL